MSTPTFTRHEHGAWCHPAADGCPSEIPAPGLSPAEAARVAEFDAASEPPESFDPIAALRRVEALAERLGDESREFYYDNRHTHEYGISYVSGMSDAMEQIGDRLRAAITTALGPS